ncbi:uncharacterized protein LOC134100064 [Sardina pilchardus]|uniref:uncharacterized protein LOC134100064 n=1 Tax=Sardina pilchardus TaxID=27697 RepID=UPI002E15B9C1
MTKRRQWKWKGACPIFRRPNKLLPRRGAGEGADTADDAKTQTQGRRRGRGRGRGAGTTKRPASPHTLAPTQSTSSRAECESQRGVGAGSEQGCEAPTKGRQPSVFCQQYSRSAPKVAVPAVPKTSRRRKAEKASAVPPVQSQEEGVRASLRGRGRLERARAGPSIVGFEIITPPQPSRPASLVQTAEGEGDEPEEEERCSTQSAQTGIRVQRSRRNRRGAQTGRGRHQPEREAPCMSGLHCSVCDQELLPLAKGVLCSAACGQEPVVSLWRSAGWAGRSPALCPCPCPCPAAVQLSGAQDLESPLLLQVENIAALQGLQRTLLPYTDRGVRAGPCVYNARWDPAQGSVTLLLQCQGCASLPPSGPLSASAALVQHPREPGRDQMWLVPAAIRFCSRMLSSREAVV